MDRADGNRRMWLLKSTSDHHRPECLAAAIALGVLAGLVPKLNLLAILLYALICVLPVHTLLAVVTSLAVSVLSFQLDSTAHAIGQLLLGDASLRSAWSALERVPLLPWMSLHNTVVLGHFILGLVLLTPLYLVSLRVFDRLEYGGHNRKTAVRETVHSYAPVPIEETVPLTTKREPYRGDDVQPTRRGSEMPQPNESTVDRSPLIIPPPKLHRVSADSNRGPGVNAPDEPVLFEPIDDAQRNINAWHMPNENRSGALAAVTSSNKPFSASADARKDSKASPVERSPLNSGESDNFFPQMTQASMSDRANDLNANLQSMPNRPEGVFNSLELAQSASEVLAWVDDLLDECLAEEGMTLVSQQLESSAAPTFARGQTADVAEMDPSGTGREPRWLVETTIEIVRLTDETMSDQLLATEQPMDCQAQTDLSTMRSTENAKAMPSESAMRAWPSVGGAATASGAVSSAVSNALPVQDVGEPTILNLNQAQGRSLSNNNNTSFQQLVMAGAGRDEVRSTLPIEPVKGECLAYLLGHLRQSREGKST